VLDEYRKGDSEENQNRLLYRIPDIAEVEIQDGGKAVLTERIPVCQYGTVMSMPVFR
jgi:hypothetical protein